MLDNARCFLLSALAPAPELIDLVFSFIDSVSTLSSLITTCRLIHWRFNARKALVISQVLKNELGPALTDAKFLSTFPYRDLGGPATWMRYWDGIHTAAGAYMEMLLGIGEAAKTGETALSLEEVTRLCRTLHHVNYLANAYMAVQLRSFSAEGSRSESAARPSQCEWQRVLRALYRRQIINNAWVPTKRAARSGWLDQDMAVLSNPSEHSGVRLRPGLLATFKSWELQQVDHVDYFTKRLCAVLRLASEAGSAGARPISDMDFGNMLTHVDCLVRYMQKHPDLVDTAFKTLLMLPGKVGSSATGDNPPEYVLLLQRYSLPCFSTGWQRWRSDAFPDPAVEESDGGPQVVPHADGRQRHVTINFAGDAVDLVPYGWVDALSGRMVPWFGEAFYEHPERDGEDFSDGDEEKMRNMRLRLVYLNLWRAAGFALWDRKRVEAIKTLDHLSMLRTGWVLQHMQEVLSRR